MTKSCSQCAYWKPVEEPTRSDLGLCRGDCPKVGPEGKAVWPVVAADKWCGHFKAHPKPVTATGERWFVGRKPQFTYDQYYAAVAAIVPAGSKGRTMSELYRAANGKFGVSLTTFYNALGHLKWKKRLVRDSMLRYSVPPAVATPASPEIEIDEA